MPSHTSPHSFLAYGHQPPVNANSYHTRYTEILQFSCTAAVANTPTQNVDRLPQHKPQKAGVMDK